MTRGGRKLPAYFSLSGEGIVAFAAKAGVSRVTLRQVIKGTRWKHITVDFALRVAKASGGMIAVEDFDSETAELAADDDEPVLRPTGSYG